MAWFESTVQKPARRYPNYSHSPTSARVACFVFTKKWAGPKKPAPDEWFNVKPDNCQLPCKVIFLWDFTCTRMVQSTIILVISHNSVIPSSAIPRVAAKFCRCLFGWFGNFHYNWMYVYSFPNMSVRWQELLLG